MNQIIEDYLLNILLIFFSFKIYQQYSIYKSLCTTLHLIEKKPVLNPASLRKFLEKNKNNKLTKSYKNPYNSDETIFTNFILKGYCHVEKPTLYSKYDAKVPLVYRLNFETPYCLNSEATFQKDLVFIKNNDINREMVNFALVDKFPLFKSYLSPSVSCKIFKNPDADWIFLEEDKTFSKKRRYEMGKQGIFKKIFKIFTTIFSFHPNLIMMGLEEKEFGLKVGSSLGVLGNLIYNYKEKSLRIEKPLYFFKEKQVLIDYVKKLTFNSEKVLILLFLGASSLIALKFYQMINNENVFEKHNFFPGNEIYTNMDENLICPKCRMKSKNIVLMPCNHLSFCEDCYYLLRDNSKSSCPCCKQKFNNFFKIYIV